MSEGPTYSISFYYRKIAVLYDGSEASLRALDLALDLARHYGSKVVVIHASPRNKALEDVFGKVKLRVKAASVDVSYKLLEFNEEDSSAAAALVRELVEGGYDAVFLGARGKSINPDINIGSTALSVVVNAPISVFLVR
ncbi:MAG: universal stress protein [Desulfurococcaceae archaeon]